MSCINKVALSRTECECFNNIPAELKSSDLNLYLDELEGLDIELINSTLGCGETLAQEFEKIASQADTFFIGDFQMRMNETTKTKVKRYNGLIGERSYISPIDSNSFYNGLRIEPKISEGLSMVVNDLVFIGNGNGTQTIRLYKEEHGIATPIESWDFEVINGINQISLESPLVLDFGNGKSYIFLYETLALTPYSNKIPCGCGEKEYTRGRLINMHGVTGNYEPQIPEFSKSSELAYGISLNVNIGCGIESLVCSEFENNDTFKYRTSIAIWYKMGVLFLEKLFASRNINFDTLSNGEYLYHKKKKFEKNYKDTTQWLADNTAIIESDCFVCDNSKTPSFGKNLL